MANQCSLRGRNCVYKYRLAELVLRNLRAVRLKTYTLFSGTKISAVGISLNALGAVAWEGLDQ